MHMPAQTASFVLSYMTILASIFGVVLFAWILQAYYRHLNAYLLAEGTSMLCGFGFAVARAQGASTAVVVILLVAGIGAGFVAAFLRRLGH